MLQTKIQFRKAMEKSNWKQKCDFLRKIPLETVLINHGAEQDIRDRQKWHTVQGTISITGDKFYNWQCCYGGGGAIDLVMHLKQCCFANATAYLAAIIPCQVDTTSGSLSNTMVEKLGCTANKKLLLPMKKESNLTRITSYLIKQRCLPSRLIYSAIESGIIYADSKANAVFLMRGRQNNVVGAELRGTTPQKWRGLAPGSDKQKGAFYVGSVACRKVSLCESAIDALSYVALYPNTLAISTAGAFSHLLWIDNFVKNGFCVTCAFDNDTTGNQMADKLTLQYPGLKRNRPQRHDWNDVLTGK